MDELRSVPDYPHVFADDDGHLWKNRKGHIKRVKVHRHSKGYLAANLKHASGTRRLALVHRLVCASWHGPCPPGSQTRHLDGDKLNNRPENLAWGTPADQSEDKRRHGRVPVGERHHNATLTANDVYAMRQMAAMGLTLRAVARHFGASETTVGQIVTGRTWKSVGGPVREPNAGSPAEKE